jgi:hypothetical protein
VLRRKAQFMKRSPISVRLHVGLHKTATTSLQHALDSSRQHLLRRGVEYVPLRRLRKLAFASYCREGRWNWRYLSAMLRRSNRRVFDLTRRSESTVVLISEEDILGSSRDILRPVLFPNAELRLRMAIDMVRSSNVRVYVSLRSYESIFASAFVHILKFNPQAIDFFDELQNRVMMGYHPSYVDLFRRLGKVSGRDSLFYWDMHDYLDCPNRILAPLTDNCWDDGVEIFNPPSTRSPSADVVEHLKRLSRTVGLDEYRRAAREVVGLDQGGGAGFRPFSDEVSQWLRLRYLEDLKAIEEFGTQI